MTRIPLYAAPDGRYGWVATPPVPPAAASRYVLRDEFNGSGPLPGRVPDVGGTWAGIVGSYVPQIVDGTLRVNLDDGEGVGYKFTANGDPAAGRYAFTIQIDRLDGPNGPVAAFVGFEDNALPNLEIGRDAAGLTVSVLGAVTQVSGDLPATFRMVYSRTARTWSVTRNGVPVAAGFVPSDPRTSHLLEAGVGQASLESQLGFMYVGRMAAEELYG